MKNILIGSVLLVLLISCDKQYICKCSVDSAQPHKKVYILAKSDGGAERQCNKQEEAGENCSLE